MSPGRGLRRASAGDMSRRPEGLGWKITGLLQSIQKNYEIDVQELTDQYNAKADEIFRIKEKEILTV